jgi:hypothetical protein
MKQFTFIALALSIWVVPLPQTLRQPSAGAPKKVRSADAQLAKNAREKQQATEVAALNSILATIAKNEQESSDERKQEAAVESENTHLQRWIIGVGIAQAFALIGTLIAVIYQSKKTAEATQAMRDSLPLQKEAADAALLNAQAAIAADRPWVSFFGSFGQGVFTCEAANLGNTPAEIISYQADVRIVDRIENLPIPPTYGPLQIPPITFLVPSRTRDGHNIRVGAYNISNISAPDPTKQIVVFIFRAVYKNPLVSDKYPLVLQHESRMCFWYNKAIAGFIQSGGGPQEYNRHT